MQVKIKSFGVAMDVKSSGMELEIRKPDGSAHIGDCYVTMTGLVWCEGKTARENGVKLSWAEFMSLMASDETKGAAVKAARPPRAPRRGT